MVHSRWRLGKRIVERALGELEVKLVRATRGRSQYNGLNTVVWNPREGFTALLHEVAHAALGHTGHKHISARIGMEAEAWTWAEEACYRWGLTFNYRWAERGFATYTSHVPGAQSWKIAWKYRG